MAYQRNVEFEDYKVDARRFYDLPMVDRYGDRARLPEDGYTGQNITVAKDVKFRISKMSSGIIHAKLGKHEIEVDLSKGLPTGVPEELR